jgi:hypothetical protein
VVFFVVCKKTTPFRCTGKYEGEMGGLEEKGCPLLANS